MTKILQLFAPTALFKLQTETFPPPLILGYLEKILQNRDHSVISIDANNYGLFEFSKENISQKVLDKFIEDFNEIKPDILIISSWTYGLPFTIEVIKKLKGKVRIILGGYNATIYPKETLELTNADQVFSGTNLFEFADMLDKTDSIIKESKPLNINTLPIVDFSSFKFDTKPKKFYFMSSFGCPYKCNFCSDRIIWKGYSSYTAKRMVKQLNHIKKLYNPLYFAFWESNISINKDYSKEFLKLYDGEVEWFTYSRAENLNEPLIIKMRKKNCRYIFLGLEHTDHTILRYFNKTLNPEKYMNDFWKSLKLMNKYDISPVISLIIGSPKETKTSLKTLFKDMKKIKKICPTATFELSPLTLEIGTRMWKQFLDHKFKLFKTKQLQLMREYTGIQLFSEKYDDVMLTPQNFLFKNDTLKDHELEKTLISFITQSKDL